MRPWELVVGVVALEVGNALSNAITFRMLLMLLLLFTCLCLLGGLVGEEEEERRG